jgi:hypothetical protein
MNSVEFIEEASATLKVDKRTIEDAYRCTPTQQRLFSLTGKGSTAYIKRWILKLQADVDLVYFRAAVQTVVDRLPILRSRIFYSLQHGYVQVVIRSDIVWEHCNTLREHLVNADARAWDETAPLCRYVLTDTDESEKRHFVWTMHHLQYDGWSFSVLAQLVEQAYVGIRDLNIQPFKSFVEHLDSKDVTAARDFWKATLYESGSIAFPPLSSADYMPNPQAVLSRRCSRTPRVPGISRTTLLRAALALVLCQHTGSEEVTFGSLVSGRNEPLEGIEHVVGPTIATVPLHLAPRRDTTVHLFLSRV